MTKMNKNDANDKNGAAFLCWPLLLIFLIFVILVIVSVPLVAHGHGINTYEFNPDESRRFPNAADHAVSLKFRPQNDAMNGFDIWLDNTGNQGAASFKLLNSSGTLLASKNNATIQPIAAKEGGTRFHINLPGQVALNINQIYELEVVTNMGGLGLYYATNIELLQHNAEYNISYVPGEAVIDGQEQAWTFKYATYESQDALPPVLSNITATPATADTVKLSFNANEPVDWSMLWGFEGQEYSQQIDFNSTYKSCLPGADKCGSLLQVQPNTAYDYQIIAKDGWGNISQKTGTFNSAEVDVSPSPTPVPPEETFSTPPVISGTTIAGLTDKSIKITWQTDKAADSDLLISTDQNGANVIAQINDNTHELVHILQTGNILEANTAYYARILSRNPDAVSYRAKNLALIISSGSDNNSAWQIISFTTLQQAQGEPQEPNEQDSEITAGQENNNGQTTTTISWTEPNGTPGGGYRIDIFDENNILIKQVTVPAGTNSLTFDDLPSGDYKVVAYSDNDGVLEKIGPPAQIKDPAPLLSNFQLFSIIGLLVILFGLWRAWQNIRGKKKIKKIARPQSESNVVYQAK